MSRKGVDIAAAVPDSRLLKKALGDLADRPRRSVLISAGRVALKPMRREVMSRAPVRNGDLKNSIRIFTRRGRRKPYFADLVLAPRTGGKYNGWYAHIVEGGAKGVVKNKGKGILGKGKRYRKDVPANPFFEPGVRAKLDETEKLYVGGVNKALESRIRRLQRAAKKQKRIA